MCMAARNFRNVLHTVSVLSSCKNDAAANCFWRSTNCRTAIFSNFMQSNAIFEMKAINLVNVTLKFCGSGRKVSKFRLISRWWSTLCYRTSYLGVIEHAVLITVVTLGLLKSQHAQQVNPCGSWLVTFLNIL